MAVKYTRIDGIGRIVINNSDKRNALSDGDVKKLSDFIQFASKDDAVKLILFDSSEDFCSGVNISSLEAVGINGREWNGLGDYIEALFVPLVMSLRESKKPTLAFLDGVVAGAGFSLALNCDFRIATESARFIPSFNRLGFIPDCLGGWILPRMIGVHRAMEFYGLGKEIFGKEAGELGLVNLVVASRQDMETAHFIEKIRSQSIESLVNLRMILNRSFSMNEHQYLEVEKKMMTSLYKTPFSQSRLSTFRQNR
ncbi:enoyl-CoA hydratase/isomerase family protein [Vibrio splendidus]